MGMRAGRRRGVVGKVEMEETTEAEEDWGLGIER